MNAWPTDSDIAAFFTAQWPSIPSGVLTTLCQGSAVKSLNKFQERTARVPFVTESTDSTQYYDPPGSISQSRGFMVRGSGRLIELRTGYQSITSVAIACTPDNPTGTILTLGDGYWTRPLDAPVDNGDNGLDSIPIASIELYAAVWGLPRSIAIVGKRGYSATITSYAWNTVRYLAAAEAAPAIYQALSDGIGSVAQGTAKITYDGPDLQKTAEYWRKEGNAGIAHYRLPLLGI